ncbi:MULTISPECIES: hypothetical protein [unclassified Methylobacterium]|uniref:hypothetical protein n=1 Tax=unclassified Methylobacterium TaxID=2615210 RepID=UPI0011C1F479|nr:MULTISPECIES: hypothetical protein [unclassified Methylobacterium]QEE42258.1 hypothetical protein FVA80_28370 [Methylobacterium sp. WL1]TXN54101.1 hypothetical protein FV241_25450 [Methylobacterium sp. WL2]
MRTGAPVLGQDGGSIAADHDAVGASAPPVWAGAPPLRQDGRIAKPFVMINDRSHLARPNELTAQLVGLTANIFQLLLIS